MPNATPTLEVMTLNMEHHNDPTELRAMAADLKTMAKMPEFILCQEVRFERHGDATDPEDNTAAVFAKYLGYYCKGTKRTSDSEGIAILSRYPFAHYDSINLKSQTLRILLGFRRVSVMGEFDVPNVGLVRVADTHLTNWEFEGHVRRGQISETMEWVKAREKSVPAAINLFGGDFNAKNNWSEMDQIHNSAQAGGLKYEDHNGTGFTQGFPHGSPSKRIDFIFVAASPARTLQFVGEQLMWKSGLFKADGAHFYPSDHLGVIHTYALNPGAAPNNVRTANVND
jgi:endonuclease/exonuclease/phosphatase family metal-dependent hydrolase